MYKATVFSIHSEYEKRTSCRKISVLILEIKSEGPSDLAFARDLSWALKE
jgi:hypothetical protein